MHAVVNRARRAAGSALHRADAFCNRLYGWRGNPLYHSGALAVASFVVLLLTGIYLLLFYRIGAPWASVAAITEQAWAGRWIRSLHRYASDLAVVAVVLHALRMFLQGRSWGPRALAWVSGLVLLFVLFVCGWTGYVMVWDGQARMLAVEGARILDALPMFSESITRGFSGETPPPGAFFFLNLFLHIAVPIGLAALLWVHVSRVARPGLLPPRPLLWGSMGLLVAVSVLWPVGMAPEADPFRIATDVPVDFFYSFFLPVTRSIPAGWVWAGGAALAAVALLVPIWTRPRREARPEASTVDPRLCTGCEQCYVDCPYEAISMVERDDDRPTLVARVDPDLCVSCGICAGSCAPMGVGPPDRTGRDQLDGVRTFLQRRDPGAGDVVVVACDRGAGGVGSLETFLDAPVFPVTCAGSLHTSVVELLVRSGAGGVLVVACPPRDCWNREGPKWLEQRMYHDREAELKERVDRRRVRLLWAGARERARVAETLSTFRAEVRELDVAADDDVTLDTECEMEEAVGRIPSEARTEVPT